MDIFETLERDTQFAKGQGGNQRIGVASEDGTLSKSSHSSLPLGSLIIGGLTELSKQRFPDRERASEWSWTKGEKQLRVKLPSSEEQQVKNKSLRIKDCVWRNVYGQVYRGIYQGKEVAVKLASRSMPSGIEFRDRLLHEANLLVGLKHRNIISINCTAHWKNSPCVVMEPFQSSLLDVIESRTFPFNCQLQSIGGEKERNAWNERLKLVMGIADGMFYLHNNRKPVIHRDLKSPNVVWKNGMIPAITGFSFATYMPGSFDSQNNSKQQVPEADAHGEASSSKSDIFSFGVIMWEVLMGETLWMSCSSYKPMYQLFGRYRSELPVTMKLEEWNLPGVESYVHLMKRCSEEDPTNRPDFAQVIGDLENIKKDVKRNMDEDQKILQQTSSTVAREDRELPLTSPGPSFSPDPAPSAIQSERAAAVASEVTAGLNSSPQPAHHQPPEDAEPKGVFLWEIVHCVTCGLLRNESLDEDSRRTDDFDIDACFPGLDQISSSSDEGPLATGSCDPFRELYENMAEGRAEGVTSEVDNMFDFLRPSSSDEHQSVGHPAGSIKVVSPSLPNQLKLEAIREYVLETVKMDTSTDHPKWQPIIDAVEGWATVADDIQKVDWLRFLTAVFAGGGANTEDLEKFTRCQHWKKLQEMVSEDLVPVLKAEYAT